MYADVYVFMAMHPKNPHTYLKYNLVCCQRPPSTSGIHLHVQYKHTFNLTFAAGVVSRVENLVLGTGTLPSSWYGQTQTAAPAIVHTARIGACR